MPGTTNPDAGSDCLGFATAGRVAPSDPAKGRGNDPNAERRAVEQRYFERLQHGRR